MVFKLREFYIFCNLLRNEQQKVCRLLPSRSSPGISRNEYRIELLAAISSVIQPRTKYSGERRAFTSNSVHMLRSLFVKITWCVYTKIIIL